MIPDNYINYIAVVITNWHLIGAKAACEYLKSKGNKVRPLYLIVGHPQQGFLNLDVEGINHIYFNINGNFNTLKLLKLIKTCFGIPNRERETLYIGMPWHISLKYLAVLCKNSNFKCILYEEGAKSYNPQYHNIKYLWKRFKIHQFINQVFGIYLQKILNSKGQIIDLHPLHVSNGKLVVNESAVRYYKIVLDIKEVNLDGNVVLFVMQSIEDEYLRIMNRIILKLVALGKKVYVKEHPRFPLSDIDLRGAELIKDSRSLEVLIPVIKAKYVVGFFSTALITTKIFFNCISISLYDLMEKKNIKPNIDSMLLWFKKTFKDVVIYPTSTNKFVKLIKILDEKENRNHYSELQ